MATISTMAIKVGFDGKAAEAGLTKTADDTKKVAKAADAATSAFGRLAGMLKGANDIKSTIEMTRGVFQLFVGMPIQMAQAVLEAGAKLETLQIQFGVMAGGFDKGVAVLEKLRQTSIDTGASLEDLAGGFKALTGAGISSGDAEKLLRTFAPIEGLLGQGGLAALGGNIASMAKSGIAEASALDAIQATGINVYQALADRIAIISGNATTAAEAIEAVKAGAISATPAIFALQEAAKSDLALDAAKRFGMSFEGQIKMLKNGLSELMADIGKGFIKGLNIETILGGLRGALESISLIVKEIMKVFAGMMDISANANDVEKAFRNVRDYVTDLSETLSALIAEIKHAVEVMVSEVTKIMTDIATRIRNPMGLGDTKQANDASRNKAVKEFVQSRERKDAALAAIGDLFTNIRNKAKELDAARAADKLKPAEPVAPINENINNMAKAMADMTNLQKATFLNKLGNARNEKNNQDLVGLLRGFADLGKTDPASMVASRLEVGTVGAIDALIKAQNLGMAEQTPEQLLQAGLNLAKIRDEKDDKFNADLIAAIRNNRVMLPVAQIQK